MMSGQRKGWGAEVRPEEGRGKSWKDEAISLFCSGLGWLLSGQLNCYLLGTAI